jgi:hypothetical protein
MTVHTPHTPLWRRVLSMPRTRLGRWSVGLAATFLILFIINQAVFIPSAVVVPWRHVLLPLYGIAMLLCGLSSGVVGLIAVLRRHERSALVWFTVLPGLFVLFLLIGEVLVPH